MPTTLAAPHREGVFRRPRRSITRRALVMSAVVLTVVMCISAAVTFLHLRTTITHDAQGQLRDYIGERLAREQLRFTEALSNTTTLARDLALALAEPPPPDLAARFARIAEHRADGTWRSPRGPDYTRVAQVFAGPQTAADPATQHLYVVAHDMVTQYGRAWHAGFQDTYITTPQNGIVLYWPEVPGWGESLAAGFDMTKEPYMMVADVAHNPRRTSAWTAVYYDPGSATWLISLATPIEVAGRHVANAGHDISLNELIARTESSSLPGAHNVIFRGEGDVVSRRRGAWAASAPVVADEGELATLLTLALASGGETVVHESDDALVALGRLHGPDWYLAVVYPKTLITSRAMRAARFVLGLSIAALALQLVALLFVMRRQIAGPLVALTRATDFVRRGELATRVEVMRDDELGALSNSFNAMTQAVKERDHALAEHAAQLERRVAARTQELSDANAQLRVEMAQRAEMEIELRQAQKLESIGRLAAGLAHEINTPVQFVSDSCAFLEAATGELLELIAAYRRALFSLDVATPDVDAALAAGRASEERHELLYLTDNIPQAVERALQGLARVARIVGAMKDFAYPERSARAPADLNRAIESTLVVAQHEYRSVADVETSFGDLPLVVCHVGELNQVILNIVVNAVHAIAARGGVRGKIAIQTAVRDDRVAITIHDNGCGIPDAVIDKIFDPFFTTKALGKGTGQGLAIARAVVDKHGGTLAVASKVGEGTTFTILLPVAASADAAPRDAG